MRLANMTRSRSASLLLVRTWLFGFAFVLVLGGCSNSDTPIEIELTASGPCINGPNSVFGELGLTVEAGGAELAAVLNFETLEYCPGHEYEGEIGLEADGFLDNLEETIVYAEPGSTITVRGPGYPGAKLRTGLRVTSDLMTFDNRRVWELQAPTEPGRYEVNLYLDWEEGKAHYAFVAVVPGGTTGPAVLETTDGGLLAKAPDGAEIYFHLGGPAQGYGDGLGGVVYQLLGGGWIKDIDVMWLGVNDVLPKVGVATGSSATQLQDVSDDGRALTIQAAIIETDGVLTAGTRTLRLTDLASGESKTLLSFAAAAAAAAETGIGRASMLGDQVVISLRSLECTWFEFRDEDGEQITVPGNPRPKDAACGGPLVTGAVLLDDGQLAYVETDNDLEHAFNHPEGFASRHVIFSQPPVQEIVIVNLDTGAEEGRIAIEPSGKVVWWLEPVPGGLVASLAQLGDGLGGRD